MQHVEKLTKIPVVEHVEEVIKNQVAENAELPKNQIVDHVELVELVEHVEIPKNQVVDHVEERTKDQVVNIKIVNIAVEDVGQVTSQYLERNHTQKEVAGSQDDQEKQ